MPRPVPFFNPSPVLTFSSSGRGETAHCFLVGLGPRRSTKRYATGTLGKGRCQFFVKIKCAFGFHTWKDWMPSNHDPCEDTDRCSFCTATRSRMAHEWTPWEPTNTDSCDHTKYCKACHLMAYSKLHLWRRSESDPHSLDECMKCGFKEAHCDIGIDASGDRYCVKCGQFMYSASGISG